jgi:hypothetical protein
MSVSQTSEEPLLSGGNITIDTIKNPTRLASRRTKGKESEHTRCHANY